MKNKKIFLTLLIALVVAFLFYWFQWRPTEIRKQCFKEVYSENTNLDWAVGKEWMYYQESKGKSIYGWLYPYWKLKRGAETYRGCLLFRGLE